MWRKETQRKTQWDSAASYFSHMPVVSQAAVQIHFDKSATE